MAELPFTIRTLTSADFDPFQTVLHSAFLDERHPEAEERLRAMSEPERSHGAFEDGALIGAAQVSTRSMTLPGVGPQPIAAVTGVAVAPGHRRRGVLTALMRTQLHTLYQTGAEPLAALWASEGQIYGRFGYGMAAQLASLTVPARSPFRPAVDTGTDRVQELSRDEALPLLSGLYERVVPQRVGWLTRSPEAWAMQLADEEHLRRGATRYRFAVHPDGYAVYRARGRFVDWRPQGEVVLRELVATTPVGYAALWRYLLDVDLVTEVRWYGAAVDEPLVHLLAEPRAATRRVSDSLWVRLVDVPRALASRRYAHRLDVVLEVTDAPCPWNAGRWRLVVDGGGRAEVSRTEHEPHLELDVADLGAAYLGGTRLFTLGAAQRVRERTPGALAAASLAFADDREPHCPEEF